VKGGGVTHETQALVGDGRPGAVPLLYALPVPDVGGGCAVDADSDGDSLGGAE
jgi:hypothetical protein